VSGLRITGGSLRGRVVAHKAPAGVRPTSSRVREALFSIVGQRLDGWSVLDAFGGTGLLAFEAASRGASPVTICDVSRVARHWIADAAERLGVEVELVAGDARRLFGSGRTWDLVLLDPPYDVDPGPWLEAAASSARRALVLECGAARETPGSIGALVADRRAYGDTALVVFRASA
jgi:16S rRNA (guanine(966)-N(2))-methyltransferase RsmD